MAEDLKKKFRVESEEAMRFWSSNIKDMLTGRFGKSKVGHILILFPFGEEVSPSWISDATRDSVAKMLRKLADHLDDRRIILPERDEYFPKQ